MVFPVVHMLPNDCQFCTIQFAAKHKLGFGEYRGFSGWSIG